MNWGEIKVLPSLEDIPNIVHFLNSLQKLHIHRRGDSSQEKQQLQKIGSSEQSVWGKNLPLYKCTFRKIKVILYSRVIAHENGIFE